MATAPREVRPTAHGEPVGELALPPVSVPVMANAQDEVEIDASEAYVAGAAAAGAAAAASGRFKKLQAQLRGQVGKAIGDYAMIAEGDRVMVCLSGGKDSYTLLDMLLSLQRRAPVRFELVAVNLDQKQPGFPKEVLPAYLDGLGVPYRVVEEDTYSIVTRVIEPGKTMCGLCSRLRRGILYRIASEVGATKVALGHHRDDIVETLFLNMFYGARLKAMPPKLRSDDGRHVVIRPLAYCSERDIARYARARRFPIIPCKLCGSQDNMKRRDVKAMLAEWEKQDPGRSDRLFRSLQNVTASHLADRNLYDFANVSAAGESVSAAGERVTWHAADDGASSGPGLDD
jgi:tRNA 2-thiocytidine biosynthesis protein TtcA